jgi:phage-related protein
VFEIAADDRSGTYRAVYALKLGTDIWVLHAFQKKSDAESKHRNGRST